MAINPPVYIAVSGTDTGAVGATYCGTRIVPSDARTTVKLHLNAESMTPARKSWSRNDKGEAASEECGFHHAIEEGFLEGVIGHTVPPTGLAVVFAAIVVCCRCCIVTGVHRLGNPLHAVILANNGGEYDGKHNIQIGRYAIPPLPSDLGGELRRCRKYHLDDAAF